MFAVIVNTTRHHIIYEFKSRMLSMSDNIVWGRAVFAFVSFLQHYANT